MDALLETQKDMLEELKHILEGFLADYEYQPSICFRLDKAIEQSTITTSMYSLRRVMSDLKPNSEKHTRLIDYLFADAPNVRKHEDGSLRSYFINDDNLPLLAETFLRDGLDMDEAERKEWLMGDDEVFEGCELLINRDDGTLLSAGHEASDALKLELQTYSHRRAECIRHGITVVENYIELMNCRLAAKDAA